jgi:CheY-like chemotaxis protein
MDKQHILVIEDHEPLLAGIRDFLETEGYFVSTAVNGVEALQTMEQNCPDLIVADIMMPFMNGYAFYQTVRDRTEWAAIPIIFLTSQAEEKRKIYVKGNKWESTATSPSLSIPTSFVTAQAWCFFTTKAPRHQENLPKTQSFTMQARKTSCLGALVVKNRQTPEQLPSFLK